MARSNERVLLIAALLASISAAVNSKGDRESKILPVFQVVRFPNSACEVTGGAKNGTCYTAEECSSRGGTNAGTCASSFGVCCTFTIGCGVTSSENCTYFEASALGAGNCHSKICKASPDICQIRLDFSTFAITGPATVTTSVIYEIGGQLVATATLKAASFATQCLVDRFTVTNAPNVPDLCGTLTGEHVYLDASDACHTLSFHLGQNPVDPAVAATRTFSIKVTQYSCTYNNLAPSGCTQYFFGSTATGYVKTFNYDAGQHLADQRHVMCVRREKGNCRVCWSADAVIDVQLSGKNSKGIVKSSSCCGYGSKGDATQGFDCIMIPGAQIKTATKTTAIKPTLCGGKGGLVQASDTTSVTICSRTVPFRVEFISDSFEMAIAAAMDGATKGFKIRYFQTAC